MSSADVAALLQNLPTARLVFDRFHLLKPLELNELLVSITAQGRTAAASWL